MRTKQRIGADSFGGGLGDGADSDRVVVRPRRAADQFLQERVGDVPQFQKTDAGDDAERHFDQRQNPAEEEAVHQAPAGAPGALVEDEHRRIALPKADGPG